MAACLGAARGFGHTPGVVVGARTARSKREQTLPQTLCTRSPNQCPGRWQQQVQAKVRDVADWRRWHNDTDAALLEVDARDVRHKWALPGHVPPMHPHWHRPAVTRGEVPHHRGF